LLTLRPRACWRHGGGASPRHRVSMNGMDEVEVAQAQIADVPTTFDESVILLDVREDDEWQRGHAPGAQHIPMGQVPSRIAEIDADATLFVVCHLGGRSQRVAQYLARNGYTPVNVSGGMEAWAAAGRPVVTDDGATGVV
jgi:rhodanese-related sulfurtransferase